MDANALNQDPQRMYQDQDYVKVAVRKDVLKRLLSDHTLHADDLYCEGRKSKQALTNLLLTLLLPDA